MNTSLTKLGEEGMAVVRPVINMLCSDKRLWPQRAYPTDAGADLRCNSSHEIYPGETVLVDTGLALKIPVGWVGLVAPRSSMGKVHVSIANTIGVIDSGYRGNILVRLVNRGEDPFIIKAYDTRIAQLLIMPVLLASFSPWEGDGWDDTARSTGGFGSTGK